MFRKAEYFGVALRELDLPQRCYESWHCTIPAKPYSQLHISRHKPKPGEGLARNWLHHESFRYPKERMNTKCQSRRLHGGPCCI